MVVPPTVPVSSNPFNYKDPAKDREGGGAYHPSCTLLAQEAMVSSALADVVSPTSTPTSQEGPITAGTVDAPQPREIAVDSLAVESARLHAQGPSEEEIATLLGARKNTTNATYSRIGENLWTSHHSIVSPCYLWVSQIFWNFYKQH